MSTSGVPNFTHAPASDLYDPDEVLPRNSPLLEPHRPTLQPSPSVASTLPSPVSPPLSPGNKRSNRRSRARHSQGYAVLISHLDGHRRDTAAYADIDALASETEDTEDHEPRETPGCAGSPGGHWIGGGEDHDGLSDDEPRTQRMSMRPHSPKDEDMGALDLKSLAVGALAAVTDSQPGPANAGPTPPVTDNDVVGGQTHTAPVPAAIPTKRIEPLKGERAGPAAMPSPYSPRSLYSPRGTGATPSSLNMDLKSPTATTPSNSHGEGLAPIQPNSPRFESNGQTLPSIRAQLGDIQQLGSNHVGGNGSRTTHHGFPGSPPTIMPRLPSLHGRLASPPIPLVEPYRDPLSPGHPLAPPILGTGYYYQNTNGLHRPLDYTSSSTETPGSDHSGSTPATAVVDRMSIDGLTITGSYECKFTGCTAPPFQTQYLLNSHANVHSSARPHYCPVAGCPRGETGKGFKRKNEMIRHGLVHDSPGYVCPFCPDREHKYPRPDNLQRHVRVHHVDKDKDDPELRDVLAQRPDGPNRGRRRRGGPG
ncbi:hypothetical protein BT67DRAFT_122467 [Trichocladium antarcticum]|uniref:C2H2-type domain-containing protein n=1 Tax=Trichocladium antarcticum TaxID=1450529 RepID=A0AAN6URZ9_9PEZI|nr:hypothetical protein BT67DRAFT_122467 [Trichocladium antarcticum]